MGSIAQQTYTVALAWSTESGARWVTLNGQSGAFTTNDPDLTTGDAARLVYGRAVRA